MKTLLLVALLVATPAMAQVSPSADLSSASQDSEGQKAVKQFCAGVGMMAQGVMVYRQQGKTQDEVYEKVRSLPQYKNQKDPKTVDLLNALTASLTTEAYKVPVYPEPEKAKQVPLVFGALAYDRCVTRMTAILEKNQQR